MKRRGPPEDPQQSSVYCMEREELGGHRLHQVPLRLLRRWAKLICKQFDVSEPSIIARKIGQDYVGIYDPDTALITLDPQLGKNGLTLAHELAHHVVWIRHPNAHDHGPTWLRIYGQLLDAMRLVPEGGVRSAARRHAVLMG